ncbi:transcriptional regulator, XRE family [Segniliparus rotundus DSM 44985]|uniref:Transcriptional regulator, XRE family n=1 Tax=Segniliparus rotundus (strain ATCC BAA-972 / CDC 1076 / CIP 108378 / DSM 44985 / JCM 13578) TaxID=640132 RepID=D6ZDS8_SEGRD|nr:helix-turn-helix transcriptional regulator [Segniliparus rotundus]ADG99335.1 transcriptional regulator, XRE family [Segniliparus rotundus DSM 44985]
MSRRVLRGFRRRELAKVRLGYKRKGISNHDLARLSGVGESTLRRWQSGEALPSIDKLGAVLATLGVPISRVVVIPEEKRTLADLRVLAGYTQPQLAKAAGMSTTALSTLERGGAPFTEQRAQALAPLLDVSISEVIAAWQRARDRPPGTPA